MNNEKVEGLLAEIVQKTGFVNIDQKKILMLSDGV